MFAPTLALITRSFRLDARSSSTHLVRWSFAMFMVGTVFITHLFSQFYAAPGLQLLDYIARLDYFMILLGGIGYFSSAITEEKEEGTLGLLKMTGTSPAALLLGKSTTRLVSVLLVLGVQFPFVLLATTLGGVMFQQVMALFLALAAYLVFTANLGLLCSVVCTTSRRSAGLMLILLFGVPVVSLSLFGLVRLILQSGDFGLHPSVTEFLENIELWFSELSVFSRISAILSTGFSESLLSWQVFVDITLGLLLFLLSWSVFERFTHETHTLKPLERMLVEPFRRKRRTAKNRSWKYALAWKDFHFVAGGKTLLVVRLVLYLLFIAYASFDSINNVYNYGVATSSRESFGRGAMGMMIMVGAVELSLFSARVLQSEVQAHTLPLLLMLPTSTPRILLGKWGAVLPGLSPTIGCFLLGAAAYPEGLIELVMGLFSYEAWLAILGFLFFLSLTSFLSLWVKWGALPLALFLMYLSSCCLLPMTFASVAFLQQSSDTDHFQIFIKFLSLFLLLVLSTILQMVSCMRLESLAAK